MVVTELDIDSRVAAGPTADDRLGYVTEVLRASSAAEAPPMSTDLLIQLVLSEIRREPPPPD
jgi:hypothetical protein